MRQRPVLLLILVVVGIYAAFGEGMDRLSAAHFLRDLEIPAIGALRPVVWSGIMAAVAKPLGLGASEVMRRTIDTARSSSVSIGLLAVTAVVVVAGVVFALAPSFAVALGAFWVVRSLRNASDPIITAWLNHQVESRVRATVFSLRAQTDAVSQMTGGPAIGAVATFVSLRAGLVVATLALLPLMAILGISARRGRLETYR